MQVTDPVMANRNKLNETARPTSPFRSTVRPVPQASLVGVVVERIQQMISEHRLASGDRLPTPPVARAQMTPRADVAGVLADAGSTCSSIASEVNRRSN